MMTPIGPNSVAPVTRVDRPDAAREAHVVNPLLRVHLLLYGRYKWAITLGVLLAICAAVPAWILMPPKYEVVGFVNVKPYIDIILKPGPDNGAIPMFDAHVSLEVSLLQSQRLQFKASENQEWLDLGQYSERWGKKIPLDKLVVDHAKGSSIVTVAFTDRDPHVAAVAVKVWLEAYKQISVDSEPLNGGERMDTLVKRREDQKGQLQEISTRILDLANKYGSDDLQSQHQFKLQKQNELETELQQLDLEILSVQAAGGGAAGLEGPSTQPAAATTLPVVNAPTTMAASAASQPARVILTREDVARIDPQMRDELADESRLALRRNQLGLRLGEKHPEVQAAQSDLDAVKQQIELLLATYQAREDAAPRTGTESGGSRLSLAELRIREANVKVMYEKTKAEAQDLGTQDLLIRNLQEKKAALSRSLDETLGRIDQLNLDASASNRIDIQSYGETPTAPVASKRIPLTVALGLLGLAAGAGLVALRGLADRRVSSLLHMQQLTPAIRVLGMLPVLPDDLADPAQISLAAHCVHQIRNLLDAVDVKDKGRVLAVTSPSAGDGKTSLTLALGLSFAASGSRTLLIDCDMVGGGLTRRLNGVARRRIGSILQKQGLLTQGQLEEALRVANGSSRKFGEILVELGYLSPEKVQQGLTDQKESSVGLLDALNGEPIGACVTSVVMDGLSLLPLGEADAEHTSQLSAKALRRVIKEARGQFDLIIIDTGPILGSLEASIAAREADEVILAIARGAPSPLVTRSVELLASVGARLGGIVFNRATPGDVAFSNYGSTGSLRSLRSSDVHRRSVREPRGAVDAPPRLGPVASAVASAANGASKEAVPHANGTANGSTNGSTNGSANGSVKKSSIEPTKNGSGKASPLTTAFDESEEESGDP